jgi:hypothetical protein
MKYVKMLGLAAVAAAALMAFVGAGSASASMLCSEDPASGVCAAGQTWPANTEIDFSLVPGSSAHLEETAPPNGESETLDTCEESTVKGKVTNTGSSTATVTGNIEALTWGKCTWTTKTVEGFNGKLEIHTDPGTTGGGILTSDGETRVTISIPLFGSCVYGVTAGTSLGTLTEGKGTAAVFHANAVAKKLTGSSFTCPDTSLWTATYNLTGHDNTTLFVSNA